MEKVNPLSFVTGDWGFRIDVKKSAKQDDIFNDILADEGQRIHVFHIEGNRGEEKERCKGKEDMHQRQNDDHFKSFVEQQEYTDGNFPYGEEAKRNLVRDKAEGQDTDGVFGQIFCRT